MKLKLLAIICTTFAVTACSIKIEERRCERDLDIHLKYQDSCAVESQPYEGGNNGDNGATGNDTGVAPEKVPSVEPVDPVNPLEIDDESLEV